MTVTDFISNIVDALDVINADWSVWVVGAIAVGAALKVGPRLVKRFM
jgi:hypothetical protein